MEKLTALDILNMRRAGQVVYVMPRLRRVCINGFKQYTIDTLTLDTLRKLNNGKIN